MLVTTRIRPHYVSFTLIYDAVSVETMYLRSNMCRIAKDNNMKCEDSNIFIKLFELVETRGPPLRNMKTVVVIQQSVN
jgi:hypothetical protein